jgi:hypothetical protein
MRRLPGLLLTVLLLLCACQRTREASIPDRGSVGESTARGRENPGSLPKNPSELIPVQRGIGLKELAVLNRCGQCHTPTAIN